MDTLSSKTDSQNLKNGEVDIGEFRVHMLDPIGSGAFGCVYSGFKRQTKQQVAAKAIVCTTDYMKEAALEECKIAKSLSHPNLVELFDFTVHNKTVWLFYEFCKLGNLAQYLKAHVNISFDYKCYLMTDIACALEYLHNHKPRIIHRDIKPENIVLTKTMKRDIAKLTDFGNAKIYDISIKDSRSEFYQSQYYSYKGTKYFMAPEFFLMKENDLAYTPTVDLFSLGLLFKVMIDFGPHQQSTIPIDAKKDNTPVPFGYEMAESFKKNKPLPKTVEIDPTENNKMVLLKQCICRTTAFLSQDRGSLEEVKHILNKSHIAIKHMDDQWMVTVGITIGATRSGYAFSTRTHPNNITVNTKLGTPLKEEMDAITTSTSVLTDKQGNFVAYGSEAESEYSLKQNDKVQSGNKYMIFRDLSMILQKIPSVCTWIDAHNEEGKALALDIFAHAMRYLKNHVLLAVKKNLCENQSGIDDEMRWLIMVPNKCAESSKEFLRNAAIKAELIRPIDSPKLIIVSESEAAMMWYYHLFSNPKDSTHLLVDAGERTVCISAHKVQNNAYVKTLTSATECISGDIKVIQSFVNLLEQILSKEFITYCKINFPRVWNEIIDRFKGQLKNLPLLEVTYFRIKMPIDLFGIHEDVTGKNICDVIQNASMSHGVNVSNGFIRFQPHFMRQFVDQAIKDIVCQIRIMLSDPLLATCKQIFLVGESVTIFLLKELIDQELDNVHVFIPHSPGLAKIKGAVLLGHEL